MILPTPGPHLYQKNIYTTYIFKIELYLRGEDVGEGGRVGAVDVGAVDDDGAVDDGAVGDDGVADDTTAVVHSRDDKKVSLKEK